MAWFGDVKNPIHQERSDSKQVRALALERLERDPVSTKKDAI